MDEDWSIMNRNKNGVFEENSISILTTSLILSNLNIYELIDQIEDLLVHRRIKLRAKNK